MESQQRNPDLRSILLLIFSLGGTALAISAAIVFLILGVTEVGLLPEASPSPLAPILTASSLLAVGLLLFPAAWLSLKRLRGQDFEPYSLPPLRPWVWIVLLGLWVLALTLATLFQDAPRANWYAPFLHFFSIVIPIYLVIHICINRIPLGSNLRAWGVFSTGMAVSPL